MASTVKHWMELYEESLPHADPRTRDWFLLNRTPVYVWALTILYLLFVWLGPKYMRNRPAYNLQAIMIIYNFGLVALSIYMFVEIVLSAWELRYNFFCAEYNEKTRQNPGELRMANVLWWYFFSKAIEFLDTVLMVLRKKNSQITFLHVYHHASMLNIWWWVMMFIPGGQSCYGSCLNSLVHVIMYAYYGLTAIPSMRGKLWWKRYLTRFQLIQFCCTMVHTVYSLYVACDFPSWGQKLLSWYMVSMLILFGNFYMQSYIKTRHAHAVTTTADHKKHKGTENGNSAHVVNGLGSSKSHKKDVSQANGYYASKQKSKKSV